jgi:hypothetical protein
MSSLGLLRNTCMSHSDIMTFLLEKTALVLASVTSDPVHLHCPHMIVVLKLYVFAPFIIYYISPFQRLVLFILPHLPVEKQKLK